MYASDLSRRIPKKKIAVRYLFSLFSVIFIFILFFVGVILSSFGNSDSFFIILMLAFLVGALGFTWYEHATWKDKWEELARQLGLTYAEERKGISLTAAPLISGTYKSHPVKFDSFTRGSGKYRRYYTEIQVFLTTPPISQALKIERATWFNRIGKAAGSQSSSGFTVVETNDLELNRRIVIQANPAMFANQVLMGSSIQQGLGELVRQAREMNLTVENSVLRYFERERIHDTEYLRAVLDLLVEMVGQVERTIR